MHQLAACHAPMPAVARSAGPTHAVAVFTISVVSHPCVFLVAPAALLGRVSTHRLFVDASCTSAHCVAVTQPSTVLPANLVCQPGGWHVGLLLGCVTDLVRTHSSAMQHRSQEPSGPNASRWLPLVLADASCCCPPATSAVFRLAYISDPAAKYSGIPSCGLEKPQS